MSKEIPVIFNCQNNKLVGIVHQSTLATQVGVLLVVGGPQYRVGSHRQFVLLARTLATNGISVMRFDYRGMGDSKGDARTFENVDGDIAAATNVFLETCPNLSSVIIWGLCDAASAALFYAYQDERIKGLVLLNPWVYTDHGAAKTFLKHYYLKRLFSKSFWLKVISLKFDFKQSFKSLLEIIKKILSPVDQHSNSAETSPSSIEKVSETLALPIRLRECLNRFKYPVLFLLSGRDLTADEFKSAIQSDNDWQALFADSRITRTDFLDADHTFSSGMWREQVAKTTIEWIKTLC